MMQRTLVPPEFLSHGTTKKIVVFYKYTSFYAKKQRKHASLIICTSISRDVLFLFASIVIWSIIIIIIITPLSMSVLENRTFDPRSIHYHENVLPSWVIIATLYVGQWNALWGAIALNLRFDTTQMKGKIFEMKCKFQGKASGTCFIRILECNTKITGVSFFYICLLKICLNYRDYTEAKNHTKLHLTVMANGWSWLGGITGSIDARATHEPQSTLGRSCGHLLSADCYASLNTLTTLPLTIHFNLTFRHAK